MGIRVGKSLPLCFGLGATICAGLTNDALEGAGKALGARVGGGVARETGVAAREGGAEEAVEADQGVLR